MNKQHLLITVVLVLVAAALISLFNQRNTITALSDITQPIVELDVTSRVIASASEEHAITKATTPAAHDQLVFARSLQGTDIDGSLRVGPDGLLILNQGVRDFFDYFLSAADEIGPQAAIAEIQRYIDSFLPETAAIQAHGLFANYLRYTKFEFELQQQPLNGSQRDIDSLQLVRETFDSLKDKRASLFSDQEDEALFGLEQVYQEYTLSTLELFSDQTISDEDRMERVATLEAGLPPELRASRSEDALHRIKQDQIQQLSSNNNDDTAFHQALTEQGLSQDKADELVAYRQHQQSFEKAYQQYRRAVAKIHKGVDDYELQVSRLQAAFFSSPEDITRAKLLDISRE